MKNLPERLGFFFAETSLPKRPVPNLRGTLIVTAGVSGGRCVNYPPVRT